MPDTSEAGWITRRVGEEPIQTKVGFEFQTGWQIGTSVLLPLATTALTKNKALVQGTGWKLTRDDGDAEFVTDAVEEGDRGALAAIFLDLRGFTERLIATSEDPIATRSLGGSTVLGKTTEISKGAASMPANPQLTAGVDLAKLTEFMRQLGDVGSENQGKFVGARAGLMADLAGTTGNSPEYNGLVALMASYVYLSTSIAGYADTPKNITTLMSRTNFADAYQLTPESQTAIAPATRAATLLADVIQAATTAGPPVRFYAPIANATRLVPPSTDDLMRARGDMDQLCVTMRTGPTIQEWVTGVVGGSDLLSGLRTVRNVSMGSKGTEGVSNIKRATGQYSGIHATEGVMLEFRDLKKQIPQREWGDWALALADWVTAMNSSNEVPDELPEQGSEISGAYDMARLLNEARTAMTSIDRSSPEDEFFDL